MPNDSPPGADAGVDAIDRREAIRRVSFLLGGVAFVGGSGLLEACAKTDRPAAAAGGNYKAVGKFGDTDVALLDEVADTILPTTAKSPGAKAAATGPFMALMVTDTYVPADQQIFRDGLGKLDDASKKMVNATFLDATPAQRLQVLTALDKEQKAYTDAKKPEQPAHYFRMMKELAMLGYFTSEVGMTKAQRYVESPGHYDPCAPYRAGEVAWANHA